MYQPKLEFLKTQKFINLKRRCNKNPPKHWERERERERESLFMRENYAKNGKEWQIYSKREGIRETNKGRWRERWIAILK